MANLSTFSQIDSGRHFLGFASAAAPTAIWLALCTSTPNDTGIGAGEVVAAGYARISIGIDAANWTDVGDGTFTNANIITFGPPAANWGIVSYFALMSLVTAGQIYSWNALTTPQDATNGSPVNFPVGSLVVEFV